MKWIFLNTLWRLINVIKYGQVSQNTAQQHSGTVYLWSSYKADWRYEHSQWVRERSLCKYLKHSQLQHIFVQNANLHELYTSVMKLLNLLKLCWENRSMSMQIMRRLTRATGIRSLFNQKVSGIYLVIIESHHIFILLKAFKTH